MSTEETGCQKLSISELFELKRKDHYHGGGNGEEEKQGSFEGENDWAQLKTMAKTKI